MNLIKLIWGELVGLFVDDEFLAVAVLIVVAIAALCAFALRLPGLVTGALLIVGCVGVLVISARRALRRG